jgi:hypothetical protein
VRAPSTSAARASCAGATGYVWNWPKLIDRDAVESALRLDFLAAARNVVLVAPQCLGKTIIAQNIAH